MNEDQKILERRSLLTIVSDSVNPIRVYDALFELLNQVDEITEEEKMEFAVIMTKEFSFSTIETEEISLDYHSACQMILMALQEALEGEERDEQALDAMARFHQVQLDIRLRTLAVINFSTDSVFESILYAKQESIEVNGEVHEFDTIDQGLLKLNNPYRVAFEGLVVIETQVESPPAFLQTLMSFASAVLVPFSADDYGHSTVNAGLLASLAFSTGLNGRGPSGHDRKSVHLLDLNPVEETRSLFHPEKLEYDGQQNMVSGVEGAEALFNSIASRLRGQFAVWKAETTIES